MGGSSTTLSIVLKLVDEASAAMQGVGQKLASVGQSMTSAGRTLSTDLTLPIVGVGVVVSKMAMDYQTASEQLVTQAGYSQEATDKLTKSVLDFAASGQAQQSVYSLMHDGLYHIASLGVPAANAMEVLKIASTGAALGQASLESVSSALGAAVASNIKGSGDYEQSMAILNATVGAGNMRMQDLATSLGNVLPQATTAGLSLKDIGAAMATMTDNGMPAADAATRLHMAIALMSAPTGHAQKALESINMTQFALADDMRNKGLLPALQDLHDHLVNSDKTVDEQAAVLSAAFGGGRSAGAIELLLNNLDRVGQKYQLINEGVDTYQQKIIAQGQTAGATFAEMQASISASATQLGNALLPLEAHILPMLASGIEKVVNLFVSWPKPVQEGIVIFLALLATLGPVLLVLGSLITVVTTLTPAFVAIGVAVAGLSLPLIILMAMIGALAIFIATHWRQIKDGTQQLADDWRAIWQAVGDWWSKFWNGVFDTINGVWTKIQGIINSIRSAIASVTGAVSSVAGGVGAVVSSALHVVGVHDAVITPNGQVIQTDPADYLFATKNPGSLGGGGTVIVNIMGGNCLDSSGATMIANAIGKQIIAQLRVSNFQ